MNTFNAIAGGDLAHIKTIHESKLSTLIYNHDVYPLQLAISSRQTLAVELLLLRGAIIPDMFVITSTLMDISVDPEYLKHVLCLLKMSNLMLNRILTICVCLDIIPRELIRTLISVGAELNVYKSQFNHKTFEYIFVNDGVNPDLICWYTAAMTDSDILDLWKKSQHTRISTYFTNFIVRMRSVQLVHAIYNIDPISVFNNLDNGKRCNIKHIITIAPRNMIPIILKARIDRKHILIRYALMSKLITLQELDSYSLVAAIANAGTEFARYLITRHRISRSILREALKIAKKAELVEYLVSFVE